MKNIYDYDLLSLEEEMLALNQKKYRATQLFIWLYKKGVEDFDSMSDVSLSFRETLKQEYKFILPKIHTRLDSLDGTIKLLLELEDGSKVETVLMRYEYGNAICVSSQVGCNMGCKFCASGLLKKKRNLSCGEMLSQVLTMDKLLKEDERVDHIVVMGTGEPFDNYDEVLKFVKICNNPKGLEIAARHITISTSGLVPGIERYANETEQFNLAISLHAPIDSIRSELMPVNNAYPIKKLFAAIKNYEKKAGRRVTFEYIMIDNLNDTIECAKELTKLLKGITSYVNLIPYNEVETLPYKRSSKEHTKEFMTYLKQHGVNVTVRKEFGGDIDAACGQLRARVEKKI